MTCCDAWQWDTDHYSTMAYLINRHGMERLLSASRNANLIPQPVVADLLLYNLTRTYTLSRPLFATRTEFSSSIQNGRDSGNVSLVTARSPLLARRGWR